MSGLLRLDLICATIWLVWQSLNDISSYVGYTVGTIIHCNQVSYQMYLDNSRSEGQGHQAERFRKAWLR